MNYNSHYKDSPLVNRGMRANVWASALSVMDRTPNLACTCKLAHLENGTIVKYTFNQAKQHLDQWLAECDNERFCKNLFETFQKCECKEKS